MNAITNVWGAALMSLSVLHAAALNAEPAVRFLAIGDVPYSESEHALLADLLETALSQDPAFLVHVGDIKGGSALCTEAALARIAGLFRSQPVPVVYTPGDNEWTDCRRPSAGEYDPQERLGLLRRLFYSDPSVLRLGELGAEVPDQAFPENFQFLYEGVLFATVHVVGSRNNLRSGDPESLSEYRARSAANRRSVERIVATASAAGASAVVLIFHADPGFESDSQAQGFDALHEDIRRLLRGYSGPVLLIHGDTHRFTFDHPVRDPETGISRRRLSRLEVPGSPIVGGVWVTVDPTAKKPFSVKLVYPDARKSLLNE